MSIFFIQPYQVGEVDQYITRWKLICNDTLAQVTSLAYLNEGNLMGYIMSPLDIVDCYYAVSGSAANPGSGEYVELLPTITHVNSLAVITLNPVCATGILAPTVIGDLASFRDTGGCLTDSGITAASVAALLAGSGGGGGSSSGVRSATISGSFPTATTVITDPAITAASVVIAAFVSSANVVSIQTVLPAAGQFTINTDTAPSTAVLEYISFIPSAALLTAGVVAGKTSFSSGPATFVMSAPGITPGMVVVANFQSQGTPSRIYTATAGTDQITFVVSSGPGVSVMEWVGMLPGDIAPLGLHAASYSYAGGAASVAISDAAITTSSIAVANFKSEAGANYIQKVTPSSGTLTVLVNADPGVSVFSYIATAASQGGTYLQTTNNLSDVASAPTSLANLGAVPLAGGQMTGQLLLDRGTAVSTAAAATVNKQIGVITTEALTTASNAEYVFTLTNSRILATSVVLCGLMGGTNTLHGLSFSVVPSAGSAVITIKNNDVSASALNGTLIFGFEVL